MDSHLHSSTFKDFKKDLGEDRKIDVSATAATTTTTTTTTITTTTTSAAAATTTAAAAATTTTSSEGIPWSGTCNNISFSCFSVHYVGLCPRYTG